MNSPKLFEATLYALLAAAAFAGARYGDRWPEWARAVLVLVGIVLAVSAAFAALAWVSYTWVVRFERYRDALATTERTVMLDKMAHLSPDQAAMIEAARPVIEVLGGSIGPVYALRVQGGDVPFDFVREFMNLSEDSLYPIREFAEGSNRREWAAELTAYFIGLGFARSARGNQPASWIDRSSALVWLGFDGKG